MSDKQAPAIQPAADAAAKKNRQIVMLGPVLIVIIIAAFWLPQLTSNAAAVVNGESISRQDLDRRVALEQVWLGWTGKVAPTAGQEATQFRSSTLNQMVQNRLVLQEAKKAGITASTQDVAAALEDIKKSFQLTEDKINQDLLSAGLTRLTLENVLHEDAVVQRFQEKVILAGVAAVDQETALRNWYNNALAKANIEKRIQGGGVKVGQPAPDFTLLDMDGKAVRLSDYKGRPVLINFFATWCTPCREEMPDLEAAWKAYKERGFVILAVNLTDQDNVADVAKYVKDLQLTFPVVLDKSGSVSTLYRVGPIPSSYFVGKDGVLSAVQIGAMSRQTIEKRLAKIL